MPSTVRDILAKVLVIAWRRRYLFVVPLLVIPPLAIVASMAMPKVFEARMKILVQEPAKLIPFLSDFAVGQNLKERMAALDALLHSEHVLGSVLKEIRGEEIADKKLREVMLKDLSTAISADFIGSDLIELKIRRPWSAGLADTLNRVGDRFIGQMVAPERSALASSERFLETQLTDRQKAVADAEKALAEFKVTNAQNLPSIYSANVQRLVSLKQTLEEKSIELASLDASFQDLRARLQGTNPLIGRIEESIIQLTSELSSLRARYTDQHSEVQDAERKLDRLRDERRSLLESSRSGEDADLSRLWNITAGSDRQNDRNGSGSGGLLVSQMQKLQDARAQRVALAQEVEQRKQAVTDLQNQIASFGPIEQELQRLDRRVAMARETQESLAKRYEMARVSLALGRFESPERVKIIEDPMDPSSPVTPGKIIFLLAGILAGLGLGAGLAALAEILDSNVRNALEFEQIAGVPVIVRLTELTPAEVMLCA
jgi:polysaccharide chain length determinant protein (PEP-CTERM system associated)